MLVPVLASIAPLVVIPAVSSTHGPDGWASIAVGLAVGNGVAMVADLGWTVVGPQRIHSESDPAALYRRALAARSLVLLLLLAPAAAGTALLAPSHATVAVLTAVGVSLGALSPAWWLVGHGAPWRLMAIEVVPRCACNVGAAVAISTGADLVVYGLAQVAATAIPLVLATTALGVHPVLDRQSIRSAPRSIREHAVLAGGRAVSSAATVLPVIVISAVAPTAVPVFAAMDRPLRMGLQIVQALPARLHSWLGAAEGELRRTRVRTSLALNGILALLVAIAVIVAMPTAVDLLFASSVSLPTVMIVGGAVLAAGVCCSRGVGLALVAFDQPDRTGMAAAAVGVVALPAVLVGTVTAGATGAVWGLVLAEAVGIGVLAGPLARELGWRAA